MKFTEHAKKSLCLLLALLTLLSFTVIFTACGETSDDPAVTTTADSTQNAESETAEIDTRFDGVKYDGREFRIYTSTNEASTMGTSNMFIEGIGQMGGGEIRRLVYTFLCCKKNNCMVQ